jgi:hypothetical protein
MNQNPQESVNYLDKVSPRAGAALEQYEKRQRIFEQIKIVSYDFEQLSKNYYLTTPSDQIREEETGVFWPPIIRGNDYKIFAPIVDNHHLVTNGYKFDLNPDNMFFYQTDTSQGIKVAIMAVIKKQLPPESVLRIPNDRIDYDYEELLKGPGLKGLFTTISSSENNIIYGHVSKSLEMNKSDMDNDDNWVAEADGYIQIMESASALQSQAIRKRTRKHDI